MPFNRAVLFLFFLLLYLHWKGGKKMDKKEERVLSFTDEDKTFNLQIVKKRVPMHARFLTGDEARNYINLINQLTYFYRFFETRIAIRKGDVFVARFSFECGNELSGDHFVAALLDSSPLNPVVTVIPLKSLKGKPLNPASDILLGTIAGIKNGKESVAIINQIRTIDKRRLFNAEIVKHLDKYLSNEMISEYQEITVQYKRIYRLSNEQYEKIHKAIGEYVFNGFIKHD